MLRMIFIINIVLFVWVVLDARRRGSDPYLWGIVTFFLVIIGFFIYLFAGRKGSFSGTSVRVSGFNKVNSKREDNK